MKRFWTILLIMCLVFQLAGCKKEETTLKNKNQSKQTENVEKKEKSVAKGETEQEEDDVAPTPVSAPTTPSQTIPTPPVEVDFGITEEVEIKGMEKVEVPEINTEIEIETFHKELSASNYYQYTGLSSAEKTIYSVVGKAIRNGETYVELSSYNCTRETLSKIFYAVRADHPQYFYLTNQYAYQCETGKNKIETLVLLYLDGTNADDITNTVVIKADRKKIASQITAFNKKVEEVLKSIPTQATALEKEKLIYDYLQDSITYDSAAAQLVTQTNAITSHAFDAYGAVCEGKAVCEGYAELFQYLCYSVGINATQVCGVANGGSHMWNTAYVDSEWYMLDVTWDDHGSDGLHYYTYFDITTSEMYQRNHTVDTSNIRVPECVSTKHAFYNDFAFYVEGLESAPKNYQTVIDYVVKSNEKYVVIYAGTLVDKMASYIGAQILSTQSEVQKYIKSKGYDIKFNSQYLISEGYCYLRIK